MLLIVGTPKAAASAGTIGDGSKLAERAIDAPPVFDGLIAAGGRLFASLEDGSLMCLK